VTMSSTLGKPSTAVEQQQGQTPLGADRTEADEARNVLDALATFSRRAYAQAEAIIQSVVMPQVPEEAEPKEEVEEKAEATGSQWLWVPKPVVAADASHPRETPQSEAMERDEKDSESIQVQMVDDHGAHASLRISRRFSLARKNTNRVDGCHLNGCWCHSQPAASSSCFLGCDCCLLQLCCTFGIPGLACYSRAGRHLFAPPCCGCLFCSPILRADMVNDKLSCEYLIPCGDEMTCQLTPAC